jgi:glycosyltransferase involved in cell wall biosynthesis
MLDAWLPAPEERLSGGTLYDKRLIKGLRNNGVPVSTHWVDVETFDLDWAASKSTLHLVDGLLFHLKPEAFLQAHKARFIYLSHLPFWLEPGIGEKEKSDRKEKELAFMKRCQCVISTSPFIKKQLVSAGIDEAKCEVIKPEKSPLKAKSDYGIKPQSFLMVASVHYGKGIDILISALAQLSKLDWQLNVVGAVDPTDEYFLQLKNLTAEAGLDGKIAFLGAMSQGELTAFYQHADVLLHPSRFETYGMVIAEALTARLPVLCSGQGAMKSEFSHTPVKFVSANTSEGWKCSIKDLYRGKEYSEWTKRCNQFEFNSSFEYDLKRFIQKLKRID